MHRTTSLKIGEKRHKAVWGFRKVAIVAALAIVGAIIFAPAIVAQGPQLARPILDRPLSTRITIEPLSEGVGAFRPLRGARGAIIHGVVQNTAGYLVPNAGVVIIRRLVDGKEVGETAVGEDAKFTFLGLEPGLYSAEVATTDRRVIAATGAFTADSGKVVNVVPVIPVSPASQFGSLISSATNSAIRSATTAGVKGVSSGLPVSPR
jgi:hypothetical protein